jgi:HAD superfamily hydrolase (TIGR01509 family)
MILGVIFDMDGVLVDSEPFIAAAMVQMFGEKGYTVHPDDLRPFIGTGEDNILKGVADAHQITLDLERDKARTYAIYLDLVQGNLHPLAGVLEFVRTCRERGLKIAVASSADAVKVAGNLQEIGLPSSTFDVIVSGNEVTHKKPSPEIFLEAARRLGLDPSTCLVVEDAIAGVAAAKAAGARCLALTTSFTPSQLSEADWVASTLAEAPGGVLEW